MVTFIIGLGYLQPKYKRTIRSRPGMIYWSSFDNNVNNDDDDSISDRPSFTRHLLASRAFLPNCGNIRNQKALAQHK